MKQNISWIKEQWKDKKFRGYFIIALMVTAGLAAEFSAFDYSMVKQCHLLNENSDIMSEFFFSTSNPNFLIIT